MTPQEQYRAWSPMMGEDEDDCRLFMAYDEEEAAKDYARASYRDEAYDCEIEVMVRCTRSGAEKLTYYVYPEPTVYFYAREVKP